MVLPRKVLSTFLLLLLACTTTLNANAEEVHCNCEFTVPAEEETGCRVYGQLGDGNMIPWHRASQECLDYFDVKVDGMDRDAMLFMCPDADGSGANVGAIVSTMRNSPSPATRAVQAFYSDLFVESPAGSGSYVLAENVSWDDVTAFYQNNPQELAKTCEEFHTRQANELNLQQSIIRGRLCQEVGSDLAALSDAAVCGELATQVDEVMKTTGDGKFCSAYELGPANYPIPQCDGSSKQEVTNNTTGTSAGVKQDSEDVYCNCEFTVPAEEEAGCRVYGQLGDGNMIPWHRASQECLDNFDVKVAAMDRDAMLFMCPNANGSGANVGAIVSTMRNSPSPATRAVQAFYSDLFVESPEGSGSYVLAENVSWEDVTAFYQNNPQELAKTCEEFHNRQANELNLQQSIIRGRLCQEVGSDLAALSDAAVCGELAAQVDEVMKTTGEGKFCSAYELGPANYSIPQCDGSLKKDGTDNTTGTSAGVENDHTFAMSIIAMVFVTNVMLCV